MHLFIINNKSITLHMTNVYTYAFNIKAIAIATQEMYQAENPSCQGIEYPARNSPLLYNPDSEAFSNGVCYLPCFAVLHPHLPLRN